MSIKIIQCSFPDVEKARQIGTILIEKQYAACVKIIKEIESIYFWEEKLCTDSEVLMLIKTSADMVQIIKNELMNTHPYDVPDILVLDVVESNSAYEKWVLDAVSDS